MTAPPRAIEKSHWAAFTNNLFRCLCGLPSGDMPCMLIYSQLFLKSEVSMKGDGQLYLVSSPLSSLQHPCTVVFHIKERDWLAQQLITDLRLSRPPVGTLDLTHTQKKMLPKKYILPPFGKKNEITDFWIRWIIGFMCRQSPNNGG